MLNPVKLPELFLLASGSLRIKENQIGILKAVGHPDVLRRQRLRSWVQSSEDSTMEAGSMAGLYLLRPNVCFAPDPVAFMLLVFPLSTRKGT